MYLHIGKGLTLRQSSIIAILDADNATRSVVTKKYLSDAERRGEVWSTDVELPKSLIIYNDNENERAISKSPTCGEEERARIKICMSSLSVQALEGRLHTADENR